MGMQPVPRGINAAAPAVATPAVESILEVCLLFLSEEKSLGGPWVPESVWEQAFWSFLSWEESEFSSFLSPNPKQPLLPGSRGLLWHSRTRERQCGVVGRTPRLEDRPCGFGRGFAADVQCDLG